MMLRRAEMHEEDGDEEMMSVVSNGRGSGYPLTLALTHPPRSTALLSLISTIYTILSSSPIHGISTLWVPHLW